MRNLFHSEKRPRRLRLVGTYRSCVFQPALIFVFYFLIAIPVAKDSPTIVALKAKRAQDFVDQLRASLSIGNVVQVAVVVYHPLVFSVQPMDIHKERFLLTMELGFLLMLKDGELRAAMAHELGHVWIYTHHPFLQTERLANVVGQRVVERSEFETLYMKMWTYEGASGVPIDDLLGPRLPDLNAIRPVASEPRP